MRGRLAYIFFFLFSIFVFSGCVQVTRPIGVELTKNGPRVTVPNTSPDYLTEKFVELNDSSRKVSFYVLKIDAAKWSWQLAEDQKNPKSISLWRDEQGAEIAINAAYFTASGTASGYYRDALNKRESRIAWPTTEEQKDKSAYTGAVLIKNGQLSLAYLPEDKISPMDQDSVFLTYPTLVVDGSPAVTKETGNLARRTALAEDAQGDDYIIVSREGSVTLYEFSRWLAAEPEHFVHAVNLDGGP